MVGQGLEEGFARHPGRFLYRYRVRAQRHPPRFGFMIIDGDIHPDVIERMRAVRHNGCFELYTVEAAWILAQTNKPGSIDCEYIMGRNPG